MKPAPFGYEAPTSLDEAVRALQADDAKVLAGGQSLIPILALRLGHFARLVDLRKIDELKTVTRTADGVRIGAMVTHTDAANNTDVLAGAPLVAKAIHHVGHFQIRNRGTVGGSIAHNDPAAELPAVALALDATMELVGPGGRRTVSAAEFFVSSYTTALDDDEILAAVTFPQWPSGAGFAVEEVARRHGDFALVGAVCGVHVSNGSIDRAAIGLIGLGSTAARATSAEQLLIGRAATGLDAAALADVGAAAVASIDPPDDVHASAEYRRHVGANVVARVVASAIKEATSA